MSVPMDMWLSQIYPGIVWMLMVLIMCMSMNVRKGLVGVFMLVSLGEMQPNSQPHKRSGHPELRRRSLSEKQQ